MLWSVILLGRKSFVKHILVQRETKFVWAVSAQQEQNYSQMATFCDGILRKRDDMIISLNCSQCSRRYEKSWFSRYKISWEFSAISGWRSSPDLYKIFFFLRTWVWHSIFFCDTCDIRQVLEYNAMMPKPYTCPLPIQPWKLSANSSWCLKSSSLA